jgi:glycosyltransferase involved in cell wall biosynthesis
MKKTITSWPDKQQSIKVSIVMPSLNQSAFIENAIRSVFEQDYKNVELIVADGMSTDGTIELLAALSMEYGSKMKWLSQKDKGAADAVNTAISMATGKIIGWLNSDDVYAQGAISSAVYFFLRNPRHVLVYGKGSHVNHSGFQLSLYPTKSPSTPVSVFANGSFICQPTVFFQRLALIEIGQLDCNIVTAFDFDLFVRFFKKYPKQIGMLNRIQAYSRLHSGCMTMKLRRQVALDGMLVVFKEFGFTPQHWFWTHFDEMCNQYPFTLDHLSLVDQVKSFLSESKKYFNSASTKEIIGQLQSDFRLILSKPNLYATVQPDGWVGKKLSIKYRWNSNPVKAILLICKAPWPYTSKLRLKVHLSSWISQVNTIDVPGEFTIRLELPKVGESGSIVWLVEALQTFTPSKSVISSSDARKLSFQITSLETEA